MKIHLHESKQIVIFIIFQWYVWRVSSNIDFIKYNLHKMGKYYMYYYQDVKEKEVPILKW